MPRAWVKSQTDGKGRGATLSQLRGVSAVQQDGHDLTRGPAAAEVALPGPSRSLSLADLNQAVTGRRLFSQSAKTWCAVP